MGRHPAADRPPAGRAGRRRVVAWAALAALVVLVAGLAALVADNLSGLAWLGLLAVAGLAVGAAVSWWAFTTRRRWKRLLNIGLAVLVAALLVVALLTFGAHNAASLLGLLLVAAAFAAAARAALAPPPGSEAAGGPRATAFSRPWLLVNPGSGGGRAARLGLAQAAGQLGIEVRELRPGEDPEQLAGDAVGRGADAIGMAGGDGSLGPVARVAVAHGLPFVCVPVGTRNHFARDLGLVRADPLKALDAFSGEERRVDVATVGDRLFLNNVSLGAYAAVVHEPGYRARKLGTAHAVLPATIRGERDPLGLSFQGPEGDLHGEPLVLLVSNNVYELRSPSELGARRHLDAGVLQVSALRAADGAGIAGVLARVAAGRVGRSDAWSQWTTTSFRVAASPPRLPAGVDGEAAVLDAPLEFRIWPGALRVLVPAGTVGLGPPGARPFSRDAVRRLWAVARGREQRSLT